MPSPTFSTSAQWWHWYSTKYLKCHHWRKVVRPAVWKYRKGMCCFCDKRIVGMFHCHHGEGMYKYLGSEHKHLEGMFVSHKSCHTVHTKKERLRRSLRVIKRVILGQ